MSNQNANAAEQVAAMCSANPEFASIFQSMVNAGVEVATRNFREELRGELQQYCQQTQPSNGQAQARVSNDDASSHRPDDTSNAAGVPGSQRKRSHRRRDPSDCHLVPPSARPRLFSQDDASAAAVAASAGGSGTPLPSRTSHHCVSLPATQVATAVTCTWIPTDPICLIRPILPSSATPRPFRGRQPLPVGGLSKPSAPPSPPSIVRM